MTTAWYAKIKTIISRSGKEKAETTGGVRRCQLEGCSGVRLCARWPNGKRTWPCTKGLEFVNETTARIG